MPNTFLKLKLYNKECFKLNQFQTQWKHAMLHDWPFLITCWVEYRCLWIGIQDTKQYRLMHLYPFKPLPLTISWIKRTLSLVFFCDFSFWFSDFLIFPKDFSELQKEQCYALPPPRPPRCWKPKSLFCYYSFVDLFF